MKKKSTNKAPPPKKRAAVERKHYINSEPDLERVVGDRGGALAEFSRRLQKAMVDKGFSQSDLAREAAKHMASKDFGRWNVSLYVAGRQMPGPVRLKALGAALGVDPRTLVPPAAILTTDDISREVSFKTLPDGNVWLQVNKSVSMEVAMRVIQVLGAQQ